MDQAADILRSYLRVTQHLSQQFRKYFGQFNLTFPQAMVLTVLGESGPMPISALAEKTGSANSTISGVVDRLEKLELARRTRSSQDRRVIYVALTPEYMNVQKRVEPNVSGYMSKMLKGLSTEELDEILHALDKLDAVLSEAERKSPFLM